MGPAGTTRLLACFIVVGALAACGKSAGNAQKAAQNPPAPAVVVAKAERKDVRASENFTGRVQAVDDVQLIARVQGFLEKRLFDEGTTVKPGDLLFVIDQRPFVVRVEQRTADVARAEAAARDATVQFDRGVELLRTGNIPKSEVDKREAAFLMSSAQVKVAQAELDEAKIDLGYTQIYAPIAGRIGRSSFTEGALVGPQSQPLAEIVRGDPVYVNFPVSQRALLEFRKKAAEQGRSRDVVVHLTLADGSRYPDPGKVDFLDVRTDPGTDTVTLRAVFPNPNGWLVPGQFAGVTVESAEPTASIVVPQAALQMDQAGPFVLVVDGQGKVETRRIRAGSAPEGAEVVVEDGLRPGDAVIVEGVQKVRPGQEVQVSELPAGGGGSAPQ
jgi:membrane fusion protein, multidrug efflux system